MAGLQSSVYAAVSITWAAALLALILRVIARRMMKITWWWDDYFCVSAFIFACGYSSLQIIWTANWSLGQTLDPSLAPDRREDILLHGRLLMYCSEFCYAFSIASSKLTILTLYWRLFKLSSIRIPIIVMFTVSVIWIIIRTFMVLFQCVPIQATWDKSIKNAHCAINEGQFFFGTVLTHFCMDIIILALPAFEVGKLRLPLGQKLAVIGLFLIGAIVCMASVFVIVESVHYDNKTTQMPRDVALNFMWGAVEANIAIVSGN
ncbi:Fc.00g042060.m01.CDS01 [Cosmosporella sp. VM-42]